MQHRRRATDDPGCGQRRTYLCTNPLNAITATDASGNLDPNFTIVAGTVGPPATGTDSSGGDAATDAANYPCPPTPMPVRRARVKSNSAMKVVKCVRADCLCPPIPSIPQTTTTTVIQVSNNPSGTPAAHTTLQNGTLAFTGAGPGVWIMALGGLFLLNLGFLVMTLYYRPQRVARGGRQKDQPDIRQRRDLRATPTELV